MLAVTLLSVLAVAGTASAACSAAQRIAHSKQVIYSYNLKEPGASAEAFKKVPWGDPNRAGGCVTTM